MANKYAEPHSICWDCKRAIGGQYGCNWSVNLRPVKGWVAKESVKNTIKSYLVIDCPLFKRDAIRFGMERYKSD